MFVSGRPEKSLTSKSVEGTSLALQSIDYIHGCDGLPLSVFGVGDGVADDILQEDFEDTSSLFIDEAGNTFHASTASQSANGRLGNTLDIVTKHLKKNKNVGLVEDLQVHYLRD